MNEWLCVVHNLRVGVLALQGAFIEHIRILAQLGVKAIELRVAEDLEGLKGLIIPGGESTVIGRSLHEWGLLTPIRERVQQKRLSIWGTCAGAILLAKRVPNLELKGLELLDITIERNAFGRQVDSFIGNVSVSVFEPHLFEGVFIRAPLITEVGKAAKSIGSLEDGTVVAVEQENILATAFHPELTQDTRFHEYFLNRLNTTEYGA